MGNMGLPVISCRLGVEVMGWLRTKWRSFRRQLNTFGVDQELKDQAIAASVQRVLWTAPVLSLGNFLVALSFRLRNVPHGGRELLWRNLISGVNFTVSVISMLIWLAAWRIKGSGSSARKRALFVYGVACYVLAAGLAISLIDQLAMASIAAFLLSATMVGTLYYLHPHHALLLFGLAYFAFNRGLVLVGGHPGSVILSNQVNGLIAAALGYALSLLNWLHFRQTTLQQRTIEEQQRKLRVLAYLDSLTDLPNRRFLDERIDREAALVREGQSQAALLMCDIDRFKLVNDTHGHLAGDDLLRELAALLEKNIPAESVLVRLGGEEFVILAPGVPLGEAARLAERLRELVEGHSFTLGGSEVRITLSIGVAALTGAEGVRDYYNRADRALYQAKELGRNRVVAAP